MTDPNRDGEAGGQRSPPDQSLAALFIVESLIHELIGAGVLTQMRAIAVVEIAADAHAELCIAEGRERHEDRMLFENIIGSLRSMA